MLHAAKDMVFFFVVVVVLPRWCTPCVLPTVLPACYRVLPRITACFGVLVLTMAMLMMMETILVIVINIIATSFMIVEMGLYMTMVLLSEELDVLLAGAAGSWSLPGACR